MTQIEPNRRRRRRPGLRPEPRARGFTLVELLVVLLIIAVLIALLVPAIIGGVRAAKAAAVQAEINQIAQALADFKSKFGDYPPSRVMLSEGGFLPTTISTPVQSGAGGGSGVIKSDITVGQLATRSMIALRKFWPRATLMSGIYQSGPTVLGSTAWYDFNGNGTLDTPLYVLQGTECLTFFLGGIPFTPPGGATTVTGFAKDPVNPFRNSITGHVMYSGNRTPPLYEFRSAQLRPMTPTDATALPAGYSGSPAGSQFRFDHGIPGYIDTFNGQGNGLSFYAYFSTNLGTGYDPNDVNLGVDEDTLALKPLMLRFASNQPVWTGPGAQAPLTDSPSPNPYSTGPTVSPGAAPNTYLPVQYQNPQSFQIISPGSDGMYGLGGPYTTTGNTPLPTPAAGMTNSQDAGVRQLENDNLTNFHNGKLN